jgi:glycosyltransferase involved in cell wall biosynthesis
LKKKKHKKHVTIPGDKDQSTISVCLIVKNEEEALDNCLASVKSIADELIIVDTGSTDHTIEIAKKYTDKIYIRPWKNSFSEARNHYLQYAKGNWIFQIDADEELVQDDITVIRKAIKDPDLDGVMVQILSKLRNGKSEAIHSIERIFRNNGVIHYEGRIHERIVGMKNAKVFPIRLVHYGYDLNQKQSKQKFERTVSLLKMDLADDPNNPITYHYLGCSYFSQGMFREALETSMKAIQLSEDKNDQNMIYLWSRYNAAMSYYRLGDLKNAEDIALSSITRFSRHIDAHYLLTAIYYDHQKWSCTIDHGHKFLNLVSLLKRSPSDFGNLVTCSLNEKWNTHILIGIAYFELGQETNSQESFKKGLQSAPEPFVALRAIGLYFYNKKILDKSLLYLKKAHRQNSCDETVNHLLKEISHEKINIQKKPTISCCMIVKNEEAFLAQCLKSVKNYVDEIIIVDTGSTDNSVNIAKNYTDRVYFHPWEGDFSRARNQALSYATGDWIFQIDGDEELVNGSGEKLLQTVRETGNADAVMVNIISTYSNGKKRARHNFERLFKNNGVIHYEGIVHNRVVNTSRIIASKIELMHYGYDVEEKTAYEKYLRTTDLLKKQIEDCPNDPMPHHYLGTSYLTRGMNDKAAEESILAINLAKAQNNEHPLYIWSHHNAAIAFLRKGDLELARFYSLQALDKFPKHLDSYYTLAMIAAEKKEWKEVLDYGKQYLELLQFYEENPDQAGLVINNMMQEGPGIALLIGHAFHNSGKYNEMERYYNNAYEMSDDKWQVWWNIGTFHMDRSENFMLSRHYLELALKEAPQEQSIWYMLAKLNSKTGHINEEKRCLEYLYNAGTQDIMVLNKLASLSLDCADLTTAGQSIDAVMKLDSANYLAFHNLGIFHKLQKMPDKAIEAFSKAIEINPQEVSPWFHLGQITLQLHQLDEARSFFECAYNLNNGMLNSLLYLCEIELRQDHIVDFIRWCDLILKELQMDRNKTIHNIEDIKDILYIINSALIHNSDLSTQVSVILSLLPGATH